MKLSIQPYFYSAFSLSCEDVQLYTSPLGQSSEAFVFHPLDHHARNAAARGEVVLCFRCSVPPFCTASNKSAISCKEDGG